MSTPLSLHLWATSTPFSTQAQNHTMQLKTGDPHHKQKNNHQMSCTLSKSSLAPGRPRRRLCLHNTLTGCSSSFQVANSLFQTRFSKTRLLVFFIPVRFSCQVSISGFHTRLLGFHIRLSGFHARFFNIFENNLGLVIRSKGHRPVS